MKNRQRYGNLLGFVDISLNMLMSFVVLFVFSYLLIVVDKTTVDNKTKITTTSKIVIHLSWPESSSDDIDVWTRSTNPDTIVGFTNKDSLNMFLDIDNLGNNSHRLIKQDGSNSSTFGNNEHVNIKNCSDTHITVNLHYYKSVNKQPVDAVVELIRLEPFLVMKTMKVTLDKVGQEKTVFQFDLGEDCSVKNISDEQSLFVLGNLPTQDNFLNIFPQGRREP